MSGFDEHLKMSLGIDDEAPRVCRVRGLIAGDDGTLSVTSYDERWDESHSTP